MHAYVVNVTPPMVPQQWILDIGVRLGARTRKLRYKMMLREQN
jgi:hypothetical protein